MTTATLTPDRTAPTSTTHRSSGSAVQLSFVGVLRAEAIKLRSVRSSTWTVLAAAAGLLIFGVVSSGVAGGLWASPDGDAAATVAAAPLAGAQIAQLVIGVLGVMVITAEYATGLIRTTLTAVPARLPVLWAKASVLIGVTLPAMLIALFGTFVLGQALIGTGDIAAASLGDPGVLGALVGTAGYLTGVALIGLALGTILRSTASAISALFGLVFLLPGLGGLLLPASWRDDVLQYLPSQAGSAFSSIVPEPGLLSSGAGIAVFLAWIVVPLAAAAVVLKRRSA